MKIKNIIRKVKYILALLFVSHEKYARSVGVEIGEDCWIGSRNFGSEPYLITIGNHVQITNNVTFLTHGGGWIFRKSIPQLDFFGKIVIKDNVYIGANSIILPGVVIESNVIVAAGSVVTKSIPENVIVGGNPAKIIGDSMEFKDKIIDFNLNIKNLNEFEKKKHLVSLSEKRFIKKGFLKK